MVRSAASPRPAASKARTSRGNERAARKAADRSPRAARVAAACAGLFALLLAVVALALFQLRRIDEADAQVRRLTALHAVALDVRERAGDEEIGVRGYVETGNLTFLHVSQRARAAVDGDDARLRDAARTDPGLRLALDRVVPSARAAARLFAEQRTLADRGRASEAIARLGISDDTFELYLRDLHALAAYLADEIAAADGARIRVGTEAQGYVVASGVLALLVGGALVFFVRRGSAIERSALRDPLTGLANRPALERYLAALTDARAAGRERFALLFLDLDGFKAVNDAYGHAAGDAVLREAALRMRRSLRPHDFIARVGGDEFVVLLPQVGHRFLAERLAERIRDRIGLPIGLDSGVAQIGVSVGIAIWPDDAATVTELLAHGDAAMYNVKRARKGARQGAPAHPLRRAEDAAKRAAAEFTARR